MSKYSNYFDDLKKEMNRVYEVAKKARQKGLDPACEVEIPIAENMAQRVEGLISAVAPQIKGTGVSNRIEELEKEHGKLDWRVSLKIALEVAQQKFCKFKDQREAMEIGIKTGFAYATSGVVSSPLEGFVELKLFKRRDNGKEYFCLFYSGPVRSAGGTGASVSVLIADYVRKNFGYDKYDPSEDEIKRSYIECLDYHEKVTNLQYFPSEEEIIFMCKNLPVQISGDPSEKYEVSNYKDLERVGTNRIRNGFCLVIAECLCQKAPKVFKQLSKWGKSLGMEDWEFIGDFVELQKKIKSKTKQVLDDGVKIRKDYTFIKDIVAGRPVISQPSASGGFRVRYGRSRFSGFASLSIHPSTMYLLNDYIAVGTQLKYERPGKSTAIAPVTDVNGPIIKLNNDDVVFVENVEQAKELRKECKEILYLGDILINYGEFLNRAHVLVPAGYCDEWWIKELLKKSGSEDNISIRSGLHKDLISKLVADPIKTKIELMDAIKLSNVFGVPLHPRYIFYWNEITNVDLLNLVKWVERSSIKREDSRIIFPLINEEDYKAKRVLEIIGAPHKCVSNEYVIISGEWGDALMANLGFFDKELSYDESIFSNLDEKSLVAVNKLSNVVIRDKSGTFVGARMGRPEKAKLRKLIGSPHMLFPIGAEGDRLRSLQEAAGRNQVTAEFALYYCNDCGKETIYPLCERCDKPTQKKYYCKKCDKVMDSNNCNITDRSGESHGLCLSFKSKKIDINYYFNSAIKKLDVDKTPALIKGVRGTSNKEHIPENLAKGILRATYDLYVNKDGTIRYDMTEMPATHFKPKEIGTSVKRLRELGYDKDINGNELTNEDQLLEIMPQDIILPACPESGDEGADTVFFRVANYVDDLLEKLYGLPRFYNLKSKEDLIGHIVIGLAPHTSAGTLGRIIGFIKAQGVFANFMWHAAQRRDCVFPETKFVYYDLSKKEIFYEEIGTFVEDLIKNGATTKKIDRVGTVSVENLKNLLVVGINPQNRKLVFKRIKYFVKGPITKRWVKITTATNREFTMTPTHKFMHLDKNKDFIFKNAENIKIDDKVPILDKFELDFDYKESFNLVELFMNTLDMKSKKKIIFLNCGDIFQQIVSKNKKEIISLLGIKNYSTKQWSRNVSLLDFEKLLNFKFITLDNLPKNAGLRFYNSPHNLPVNFSITNELLNLLGYYTAEGYSRSNKWVSQIAFRISNRDLQKHLIRLINNAFGIKPNLGEEDSKITICSKMVYLLLIKCFKVGSGAYEKRVPNFIFSLPKEQISHYLSGCIDGDGSIVNQRNRVVYYSVSRSLVDDIALLASRFGLVARYSRTKERGPGYKVLMRYKELGLKPKKHVLNHLVFSGIDAYKLKSILKLNDPLKMKKLTGIHEAKDRYINYNGKQMLLQSASDYFVDYVKKVGFLDADSNSYCVEIDWKSQEDKNILWGEQIINSRCDGDETSCMLLLDTLINFSRHYLPAHRGSTQDAPLVLTTKLIPSEVDEQILDIETVWSYPLELYEAALEYKQPWEVKIERMADKINTESEYYNIGFTHNLDNINDSVRVSAYKYLETMMDKVRGQMDLAERIRAVNEHDVARLLIERHFIRDIKGNLRQFSMQQFRCVKCNEKYRRPPLIGVCVKCGNRILFTVSEGTIVKYLEPSMELAAKYNLSNYLKQTLEITKMRIESTFGKDKERQEGLVKWFNS